MHGGCERHILHFAESWRSCAALPPRSARARTKHCTNARADSRSEGVKGLPRLKRCPPPLLRQTMPSQRSEDSAAPQRNRASCPLPQTLPPKKILQTGIQARGPTCGYGDDEYSHSISGHPTSVTSVPFQSSALLKSWLKRSDSKQRFSNEESGIPRHCACPPRGSIAFTWIQPMLSKPAAGEGSRRKSMHKRK